MAGNYHVFFRFDDSFDMVLDADSPEEARERFSAEELISMLVEQVVQGRASPPLKPSIARPE